MNRTSRSTIAICIGLLLLAGCGAWTMKFIADTRPVVTQVSIAQAAQCRFLLQRNANVVAFWTKYAAVQDKIAEYNTQPRIRPLAHQLAKLDRDYAKQLQATSPQAACVGDTAQAPVTP